MAAIAPQDLLARAIIYADAFEGDVVSSAELLQFKGNRNSDGSFDESLYLSRLTTPHDLHAIGCTRAVALNERVAAKREKQGKQPADPVAGEDRKYYCGYSEALAEALSSVGDNYVIELIHAPEDGVESHVSVFLRQRGDIKISAGDRTEAGRFLALAFQNPTPHVCHVDADDPHHPVTKHGPQVLSVQ